MQALCDTGFSVQDPLSGRAVVLLHYPSVRDGLPQALRTFLDSYFACGAAPPPELGVRLVPCTTIAGHCVLPAVPAKALRVGSRRVQGFLAAFCRPETPPEHWTALLDSELAGQLGAEQAAETVRAFGEAFLFSMPTGKQNSFANRTLPDAVYVTIREDQPVNLCGAFERAVPRSMQGYAEPSKAALAQYAQQMYSSFAEAPAQSFTVGSGLEALAPAQTAKAMLDALEKAVRDALAGNEVGTLYW